MILGITGGVGCGKSTVLDIMHKQYGARIILADALGHDAMEPGTDSYQKIVALFGDGILDSEQHIDRNQVAARIYKDEEKRKQLNAIVHPFVLEQIRKRLQEWSREPFIVVESALMFDTECYQYCDEVWGILTDPEVRIDRLMSSRGYTREKCIGIMNTQISDDKLVEKCSKVIDNSGTIEDLKSQLQQLLVTD